MAAAHAAAVVHGDFKPDNVLISRDRRVTVLDFGLARIGDQAEPHGEKGPERSGGWTVAGAGTPEYMAPEQIRGVRADAKSDQFSFCVALFEALSGQRPFFGATPGELAENVCRGGFDRTAFQRIPSHLQSTLRRGLSGDPEQRFPSIGELVAKLRPRPRWPILAGALALLSVAGIATAAVFAFGNSDRPTDGAVARADAAVQIVATSISDAAVSAAETAAETAAEPPVQPPAREKTQEQASGERRAASGPTKPLPSTEPAATKPAPTKPAPSPATKPARKPNRDRLLDPDSPEMRASVVRMNARKAESAGKGEACLRMLDRALKISSPEGHNASLTRGRCEMRTGKCKQGTKRYRDTWIARGGNADYASRESARLATVLCPPTDGALADRLATLRRQTGYTTSRKGRTGTCERLLKIAEAAVDETTEAGEASVKILAKAFSNLSRCFALNLVCDKAARARAGYIRLTSGGGDADQAGADWAEVHCKEPEPSPFDRDRSRL